MMNNFMFGKYTTDDIDELEIELDNLVSAVNAEKGKLEAIITDISEKDKELYKMGNYKHQLLAETDEAQRYFDRLKKEEQENFDKAQAENNQKKVYLVEELAKLGEEVAVVKQELEALTITNKQQVTKAEKLAEEFEKASTTNKMEIEALEARVESLRNDDKSLNQGIREKTARINELNDEVAIIQKRIAEDAEKSIARVKTMEAKVDELVTESDKKSALLELILADIEKSHAEVEKTVGEIDELKKEKALLDSEMLTARKFQQHTLRREEHLRAKYEEIGLVYPEFKGQN